ncbi:MAG: TfoX/Sxy family protein [Actinobacteria bacterium]|nr:TfoX/Sxy family protein [Actinomycetota bacterium]
MATKKSTVDSVLRSLIPANVRAKPMFGEYGLYCDDVFVGLVCDDRLYLKVAALTDERLATTELAAPYPGARDCYLISAAGLADDDWLRTIVQATAAALPPARRRPPRATRSTR